MLGALRASRALPALVRVIGGLLRLLALDVDSRHTQGIPFPFYLLAAVSLTLYVYTYHVSIYWFIFTRGLSDVLFSIVLFSLAISSLIGVIKLLYTYVYRKTLRQLVSEYLQCDSAVVPDSRMSRNVLATLALVRRRAAVFWLLIISNAAVYILRPLFTPGRHLLEDKQILLGLEPMFESPNYEIAFMIESIASLLTVYAPANVTAFFIILIGYTEAQMLALSQELLHLWEDANDYYEQTARNHGAISVGADSTQDETSNHVTNARVRGSWRHGDEVAEKKVILNDYVKHRLVSITKLHAIHINLIKKVENLFQNAIAIEFALLSGGLIAELLGGLENTFVLVPFAMVQVSMDCITGQKLIDANRAFEAAVYACSWEDFDVGNMKLVAVMLQNAQKTMELTAGGVASLNYLSLMSIFRSVYSAYTTLHSTMN